MSIGGTEEEHQVVDLSGEEGGTKQDAEEQEEGAGGEVRNEHAAIFIIF